MNRQFMNNANIIINVIIVEFSMRNKDQRIPDLNSSFEIVSEAQYWILDGKLMKQHFADNITLFTRHTPPDRVLII